MPEDSDGNGRLSVPSNLWTVKNCSVFALGAT